MSSIVCDWSDNLLIISSNTYLSSTVIAIENIKVLSELKAHCPSCKSTIAETGWSMEEIDVDHHRAIRANIMYCNKCQGILTIFQK